MAIRKRVYDKARYGAKGVLRVENPGWPDNPYYFETLHAGRVVELGHTYLGDGESAYWAMVWNPSKKAFEQVGYSTDRDYGAGAGSAHVDAPPALAARWSAYKLKRAADAEAARLARVAEDDKRATELRARTPRRGSYVRVARGRKIERGREGTVYWVGQGSFGERVGIQFTDGSREFTAIGNVDVLRQPPD